MSHTRFMVKQDHRVVRYYTRQMYERYRAVESIAYDMRKTQKLKTRVKIGRNDIELSTREASSTVWKKQLLPDNLPKFEMTEHSNARAPSSPPPGRPGRDLGVEDSIVNESEEVVIEDNVAREEATPNK